MRNHRKKKQAGFTLVEVMVTLVIIGLMSAIVVINVLPSIGKSNAAKAKIDITSLSSTVLLYKLEMQNFPESLIDLTPQSSQAGDPKFPQGGFIQALPNDPWGVPYQYAYPGENGAFDIWSLGADKAEGGEGENADITNWQN